MLTKSNWRPCLSPARPEANAPEKPIKSSVMHPGTHHHLSLWKNRTMQQEGWKSPVQVVGLLQGPTEICQHFTWELRNITDFITICCRVVLALLETRLWIWGTVGCMKWSQEEKDLKCKNQNPPLIQILTKSLQLDQVNIKETWESGQPDEI